MNDTSTLTPEEAFRLTPEQATTRLAEMAAQIAGPTPSATPQNPAEAQARLNALSKNSVFVQKFISGDVESRHEFKDLTEMVAQAGSRLDDVLNGTATSQAIEITSPDFPLTTAQLANAVEHLRELGISTEETLRRAIEGGGSKKDHDIGVAAKHRLLSSPDWVKKYMAGDWNCRADLTLCDVLITGYQPEQSR